MPEAPLTESARPFAVDRPLLGENNPFQTISPASGSGSGFPSDLDRPLEPIAPTADNGEVLPTTGRLIAPELDFPGESDASEPSQTDRDSLTGLTVTAAFANSPTNDPLLSSNPNPILGDWESGFFTVGDSGQVGIDFLFDGGAYVGELALFSLDGMEAFEPGSSAFIQEAARRALSDSTLGSVVISDATQGARLDLLLPWERDFNSGEYSGVQTVALNSGDTIAAMLVPHGTVQRVFDNPDIGGKVRPLFSLAPANPLDGFHIGQIADVTGDGSIFVFEDLRFDGRSDRDYNDIIFQITGATGVAIGLDEVIAPNRDWRESDLGRELAELSQPAITVSDIVVVEGDDGSAIAEFTVSLSKTSTQTVWVDFTTADGTAFAGLDYELVSGTLSFAPGETSQIVAVPILGDAIEEPDETFTLNLSSAVNAEIADGEAIATLQDDDLSPGILLEEETFFQVIHEESIEIPNNPSVLTFTYDALTFDLSATDAINDAFEAALVDEQGNSLVRVITGSRDAFFNLTEEESVALAPGVSADGQTVTVNLAGIPPGTPAQLILRLVNNDGDTETSVRITEIGIEPADGSSPLGVTPAPTALTGGEAIDFSRLSDVTASVSANYGRTSFNEETDVLYAEIGLENVGQYLVDGPLVVAVANLSDPRVRVVDADGVTPDGLPYYNLTSLLDDGTLSPEEVTQRGTLAFFNPEGVQFNYDLVVLGHLNEEPEIITAPNLEGIIGNPYRYDVDATDPEGDPVTYSLQVAPAGMTIDPVTGLIEWSPQEADRGTQNVTVQASDGRGGVTEQSFDLVVGDAPPNRPPVFTTGPVVDARVNTAYAYDADATDLDYDELTYALVDGPEGMTIDPVTGVVSWTPTAEQITGEAETAEVDSALPLISGFTLETYAEVTDPVGLSFDNAGNLYVGREQFGSGGTAADPARIHRISPGGSQVEEIGERAIDDPDTVLFDSQGLVSGIPGAVIVGGTRNDNSGIGEISAILPDGTVEVLYSSTTLGNVSSLSLDRRGRLIFTHHRVNDADLMAIENGEVNVLAAQQPNSVHLAIDDLQGHIYVAGLDGVIRIYGTNGQLLNPSFADRLSDRAVLAWGTGGYWGKDLYVFNGVDAELSRFDREGNRELIISDFPENFRAADITFGPDNALYLSDFDNDRILRITPNRETLGLDPSEHPVTITVADGQGGVAVQNYVVNVLPEEGNHDPVIVSEPETELFIPQATEPTFELISFSATNLRRDKSRKKAEGGCGYCSRLISANKDPFRKLAHPSRRDKIVDDICFFCSLLMGGYLKPHSTVQDRLLL